MKKASATKTIAEIAHQPWSSPSAAKIDRKPVKPITRIHRALVTEVKFVRRVMYPRP
jgi:hypothetical protein